MQEFLAAADRAQQIAESLCEKSDSFRKPGGIIVSIVGIDFQERYIVAATFQTSHHMVDLWSLHLHHV
ncbi:uncharacterized protein LAJ45_09331 [Morchella importuna]|uniref:uncharacterized protein n=1 Tax=Morchella importuna TaxID=1174673 RepID=UPI001E8D5EA1|nr:uncharacterized protein LAJ45_09331 [Morchella importuna]KAH8146648.1 hypothetical protein LAJ45_09331 [Morchella importuna]